jgi:hypothetical protein
MGIKLLERLMEHDLHGVSMRGNHTTLNESGVLVG